MAIRTTPAVSRIARPRTAVSRAGKTARRAAIAFASTFGVGVLLSAVSVAVVQGGLTLVGVTLGEVATAAHVAALTAVGGLLLAGIGLRLLQIRQIPVGDLLPALVFAPVLVSLVAAVR